MIKLTGAAAIDEARQRAQERFKKGKSDEADVWREREKLRQLDVDKTARLREMRLAKEAADREAAAAPKPPKPAAKRRKPATAE